jgi:hypothetical protein
MKSLSRGGIFNAAICRFLKKLQSNNKEAFALLDVELTSKYLKDKSGYDYFSQVKPSQRHRVLKSMAEDLFFLVELFSANDGVTGLETYLVLKRILREQCDVLPASENASKQVKLKDPKEIPSNSLQNPTDPDASYDGHKGKGYQAQLIETCSPEGETDEEKGLSLVLFAKAEGAHNHDGQALVPAIEELEKQGITPKTITADTSYGSDENVEALKDKGIELISSVPGQKPKNDADSQEETEDAEVNEASERLTLNDFSIDESGAIVYSPLDRRQRPRKTRREAVFVLTLTALPVKPVPIKTSVP